MKYFNTYITVLFIAITTWSCSSDDEINAHDFIGEWMQINDAEATVKHVTFNTDFSGIKIIKTKDLETNSETSSVNSFSWEITPSQNIRVKLNNEVIETGYQLNTSGDLILHNISPQPFVRVK